MTDNHREAIARGRVESSAVRAYLELLERPNRRPSDAMLDDKIAEAAAAARTATDPVHRLELIQRRLNLEAARKRTADQVDEEEIVGRFVEHAAAYGARKGISYQAWRAVGVPARVLRTAGISR